MPADFRTRDLYAVIIGGFFILLGIANLTDPPFLGIFTSNVLHAIIHILLGLAGVWSGVRRRSYLFVLGLGILLLSVGILYFFKPSKAWVIEFFFVNPPVAWLSVIIGIVSIGIIFLGTKLSRKIYY